MKKLLLITAAILIANLLTAQSIIGSNSNPLTNNQTLEVGISGQNPSTGQGNSSNNNVWFSQGTITEVSLTSSNNVFGYLIEQQSCLTAKPETELITFTHRGKVGVDGCTSSGDIFISQSRDTGTIWTEMMAYPNASGYLNRYPSGVIYNPVGNTIADSAYIVFAGPSHDGVSNNVWQHAFLGSMKMDSTHISRSYIPSNGAIIRNGMVATSDGKVHLIGSSLNTTTNTLDTIYLVTGTFNSTNHNFDWSVSKFNTYFIANTNGSDFAYSSSFNTAWSDDGSIGYYWTVGRDSSNDTRSFQPIVWKTTNSGTTWAKMPVYDFSNITAITDELQPMEGVSPATSRPQFSDKTDGVVDINGNLHIISLIKAAYRDQNNYLNYSYNYAKLYGECNPIFDVYTTSAGGWAARQLGKASSLKYDFDGVDQDIRLQAGKTTDGVKIFASWANTETTVSLTNNSPDIYVAAWDITTAKQVMQKNISMWTNQAGDCFFHYMSDIILSQNGDYTIPLTVCNIGSGASDPVDVKYLKGVQLSDTDFNMNGFHSLDVSFTMPTNTISTSPYTVSFTNTSICLSNVAWHWNFGDGNIDNDKNPIHNYAASGTYNIVLIGTDTVNNISDTATDVVAIIYPPIASFTTLADTFYSPFDVSFINTTLDTLNVVWSWDFNDGTYSDLKNPSHTYQNNSSYNITLTATDTLYNKTSSISKTIVCIGGQNYPYTMWGMTYMGGSNNEGTIFKTSDLGNNHTVVYNFEFDTLNGMSPYGDLYQASNGKLYGMTKYGGANNDGAIFEYDPTTNVNIKKVSFDNILKGKNPIGSLIQATNGKLYGMTNKGGIYNKGVLFEYDPAANVFTKKVEFDGNNGSYPMGSLIQANNGKLYGMTFEGATNNGVLFEYDITTGTLAKKIEFDDYNSGSHPYGSLIQASNGKLYGMTNNGGIHSNGVLFEYDIAGTTLTKKIDFLDSLTGREPYGSLLQASNGKLYGMTYEGGIYNNGVLFEYSIVDDTLIKKQDFNDTITGGHPKSSLIQASNGKLYGITTKTGNYYYGTLFDYDITNNVLTKKLEFDYSNKVNTPKGSLIQATNGKLYGMAASGGENGSGVIFNYDIALDSLTKKIDFDGASKGSYSAHSLTMANNGKLYGLTLHGGVNNDGVLFEFDPNTLVYTKKVDFNDSLLGKNPYCKLVQASNGKLYGKASGGTHNFGVLFEYNPTANIFTKIMDFNDTILGKNPYGSLIQATNGKLYGTTEFGGVNNDGVIFEYDIASSTYLKKVDFNDTLLGKEPRSGLMQASNGKLYGMTYRGGDNNYGVLFEYNIATNTLSKKIDFDGSNNGRNPEGSLIQTNNGKLYGMTEGGGVNDNGVLFEYDIITNTLVNKVDFDRYDKGAYPLGSLLQAPNGKLYGMTIDGGGNNRGILFEYDPISGVFNKKSDFNGANGYYPLGDLIIVAPPSLPSFTTSSNNLTSPPFDVTLTNTSPSNYTGFQWNFGDGDMSNTENPTHTYLYNGNYTVTLFATDSMSNITDTATAEISCSGGTANPCTFTAELTQAQSSAVICVGDSFRLSATALPNITYQWVKNGVIIPNETDSIFYAKTQGFYMAVLSNTSCSQVTNNYFALANYTALTPQISIIGTIAPCSNDSLELQATGGFSNYDWSNGKTGQSIFVKESGYFSVNAYDNNGCENQSDETIINVALADIPNICAVSVDANTNHNIVMWQGETSLTIDSFRVYRESSIANQYTFIGGVAYTDPLEVEDVNSDVGVRQYAYKITAIDTCGKETPVSTMHKTMHLMVNVAQNDHWNLIWRPYEGFDFGSYNIYRGTDSTNMTLLTTVSSNLTSYTDLTNPSGDIYYQIEVVSTNPCGAKSYGTSRSNSFNTKNASGLGFNIRKAEDFNAMIYPNPNNGQFTLEVKSNKTHKLDIEIFNSLGELIYTKQINTETNSQYRINLQQFSRGIYSIRLMGRDGLYYYSKIVIQ